MRGTVAKALRRQARAATEGMPAKAYVSRHHSRDKVVKNAVPAEASEKGFFKLVNGIKRWMKTEQQIMRTTTEEVRLDPKSTRGTYVALKRDYVKG